MKKKNALAVMFGLILIGMATAFLIWEWVEKREEPQGPDASDFCTITVQAVSGDELLDEYQVTVKKDTDCELPVTFSAEGYAFLGWETGETERKITYRATQDSTLRQLFSCDVVLPIVHIYTEEAKAVTSKEEYLSCIVSLDGRFTHTFDERAAKIKCRGFTSYYFAEKKSYRLKFDQKISLLGAKECKSYTLIANQFDRTMARNFFAYELSETLDYIEYTTMHEFVEVRINGSYEGVYLLCDKIDVGEGRVEIGKDTSDVDTGYLLEINNRIKETDPNAPFFELYDLCYELKSPESATDEELAPFLSYIETYIYSCCLRVLYGTWNSVCEAIDVDSFVDTYIINEWMGNLDSGAFSFFLYKKEGGKLYSGPVWDYDLAGGHMNYAMGNEETCPADEGLYVRSYSWWYCQLMNREEFRMRVHERIVEVEPRLRETLRLVDPDNPNGIYRVYREEIEKNNLRWDMFREDPNFWLNFMETKEVLSYKTLYGQYEFLHAWLTKRLDFLVAVL